MPSAKRSILYVDDDRGARLTLTLLFGQQGYEVLAVSGSQAAQFLVPEESFDLYLLGARLSAMYRAALWRKIRGFDKHTPIIICSGAIDEFEQEAVLHAGRIIFIADTGIAQLLERIRVEMEF